MQQLSEVKAWMELEAPDVFVTLRRWWLLLDFPTRKRADEFQRRYEDVLKRWSSCYRVFIAVQGQENLTIRPNTGRTPTMSQSPLILDPDAGLQLGRMKIGRSLLREMTYYLENPSIGSGFVRLADEHQCMLSAACANYMPSDSATVADAVEWRREQYWYAPDLAEFRQASQLWTPNDGEWHEFRYLTFDPQMGSQSLTGWTQYVNRFKLVTDGAQAFHVCENLEASPTGKPEAI